MAAFSDLNQNPNTEPVPKSDKEDISELFEWSAPARPFKPHSKEFYKTEVALVVLVSLILVFMGEFLLIMAILAIFFVSYVLSTVVPEQIKNKITKLGIETGNYFHKWEEMRDFWFENAGDEKMVVIGMYIGFPSHLRLMLGETDQNQVKTLLSQRLPFREKPEKTFLDKASNWLSSKIPLEKTTKI